jgi:hypothetical protein
MSEKLVDVRVVRGSVSYNKPGDEPGSGPGDIYQTGDIIEGISEDVAQRLGSVVELVSNESVKLEPVEVKVAVPPEPEPEEEGEEPEAETIDDLLLYKRGELDAIAEELGVYTEDLANKLKVAEAIVEARG